MKTQMANPDPSGQAVALLAALLLALLGSVGAAGDDSTTVSVDDLGLEAVFNENISEPAPTASQQAVTLNASDTCQTFGGPSCASATNTPGYQQPCECKDNSTSRCECVLFYQCDMKTGKYNQDGTGLIDLRKQDGCPGLLLRCCAIEDSDPKVRPQRVTHKDYPVPKPPRAAPCGTWNNGGLSSKIINANGGEAGFAEFPWMVAVIRERQTPCGGALLTDSVVVTAAHCVRTFSPAQLLARMGEWDRESEDELYRHQDREVIRVLVHPKYYAGNYRYDVALLLLETPVKLGYNVGTVCLPPEGQSFAGERCVVTGWGQEKQEASVPHRFLKKLDLRVVPKDECESMLRTTQLGNNFKLHESFICAGGEKDKDTCKGDGGGPLVCPLGTDGLHFQLAGIVAWGVDCGRPGVPGLYGNVPVFRTWIDQQLQHLNLSTSWYQYRP